MDSLRVVPIALLCLAAAARLGAEEPRREQVRLVRSIPVPDFVPPLLGFSADGRLLTARGEKCIRQWDVETGKEVARVSFGDKNPSEFAVSPDGKMAAVNFGQEKEICLFDIAAGKLVSRIPQPYYVNGLWFAPNGTSLLSLNDGHRLWDVKTRKELWRLQPKPPENRPWLAFSPDGKLLAVSARGDVQVRLYSATMGAEVRRLFEPADSGGEPRLAFSPDGRYLAATAQVKFSPRAGEPNIPRFAIRLWNVQTGKLQREFRQPMPPFPDFQVKQDEWLRLANSSRRWNYGVTFSPDGKTLVDADLPMQLWEVAAGQVRHKFTVMAFPPCCFSPDGRLMAMAMVSKPEQRRPPYRTAIHLWDWRDPCLQQPERLAAHDVQRLWKDLASADAAVAYRAIASLLAHPTCAVSALGERLRRVEPVAAGELDHLIGDLDDGQFAVRERAAARLTALGEAARPALLREISRKPSLEARRRIEDLLSRLDQPAGGPDSLRCLRAVEVLETIGTEECRRVLRTLASGAEGALDTEDAKAALKRLTVKETHRGR